MFREEDLQQITYMELVELRNQEEGRIFLFLDGYVLDVTEFTAEHPGGTEAILKRHMCDIADDFKFHNAAAQEMMISMRRWRYNDTTTVNNL